LQGLIEKKRALIVLFKVYILPIIYIKYKLGRLITCYISYYNSYYIWLKVIFSENYYKICLIKGLINYSQIIRLRYS
jgi:hypothetical protein